MAALIQGHSDTGTGTETKTEETFFAALVPRGDQRLFQQEAWWVIPSMTLSTTRLKRSAGSLLSEKALQAPKHRVQLCIGRGT